jgi:hypothetical protein
VKRFSRRDFGQGAALTLAGGALASAVILGSGASPAEAAAAVASPHAQAEIDGKLRHIFALYGDRLSDEQRQMLHVVVADHVRMLERIRAVQLHNSDPPAAVLQLIDGSGAGPRE